MTSVVLDASAPTGGAAKTAEVDVWMIDLSRGWAGAETVLDAAERAKAQRLRTPALRRRFVRRRAARRHIVAARVGIAPAAVRFDPGPNGKPEPVFAHLHVSCSHRSELAVVALCEDAPLGVDVEELDGAIPDAELDAVAEVMMSPAERTEFRSMASAQRRRALLTTWTRKEAVVKALGTGLSLPLASFDVPVDPDSPPRLLAREAARDHKDWTMAELPLPDGYVGTVMAQCRQLRLHVRRWEPPA